MTIVYTSHTGYTRQYAVLLSEATGLHVLSLKEAMQALPRRSEVVYMGWIMANRIRGLEQAKKRFVLRCVCGVGMNAPSEQTLQAVRQANRTDAPLFCLQGGLDPSRLRGLYRLMIRVMAWEIRGKAAPSEEERKLLQILTDGGSCVRPENLADVLTFLAQNSASV